VPEGSIVDSLLNFLIQVVILMLTFSLAEEIGIRGYLLPKLLSLGRTRALASRSWI
jgi:membrane protease YdiL (CAAX protease family)